ncbi:MAG: riboflavin synthase [Gammaproteobacteria bacterium]|nr:riboflavin synthase [Gammaproteobacteria bacterium]MCP5424004.1 riboflavin synthase [Gammaproteobacteria bacterium]
MFTGIIEAVGAVLDQEPRGVDMRLHIGTGKLDLGDAKIGDSIAVSGVCLTVVAWAKGGFWADVSAETLERTVLGEAGPGASVNLEQALTLGTRLGGHLVSGHVDGVGTVSEFRPEGRSWRLRIQAPANLARYIAEKGSICVDGVSLTVNDVDGALFGLNIVPHTFAETTLADYRAGRRVNLEVDLLARYLERLMLGERAAEPRGRLSEDLLREHGYL